MDRTAWSRCILGITIAALPSCSIHSENVFYGGGRATYPGYSVEFVDATPSPGSPLIKGSQVTFEVRVRYSLMRAQRGRLQLQFSDQNGEPVLLGSEVGRPIVKTSSDTALLSQSVTVPDVHLDLVLAVFVVPEDEKHPVGDLRIRYPVNSPPKQDKRQ